MVEYYQVGSSATRRVGGLKIRCQFGTNVVFSMSKDVAPFWYKWVGLDVLDVLGWSRGWGEVNNNLCLTILTDLID